MQANYNKAKELILARMIKELPHTLVYHTLEHTTRYVLPAVDMLGRDFGLSVQEKLLVKTAALFHDSGYIRQYTGNEQVGADIAGEMLPDCRYDRQQIRKISEMILATRMPQHPTSVLSEILCDADLASLGMVDFFETSMMLRREVSDNLKQISLKKWLQEQCLFLNKHQYFTLAARNRFGDCKRDNLLQLQELVLQCGDTQ